MAAAFPRFRFNRTTREPLLQLVASPNGKGKLIISIPPIHFLFWPLTGAATPVGRSGRRQVTVSRATMGRVYSRPATPSMT